MTGPESAPLASWVPRCGPRGSVENIWPFFEHIEVELGEGPLSRADIQTLSGYYEEAGLLTRRKRTFFRKHFAETLSAIAAFLLGPTSKQRVLDLGSGTGSQAIALAMMGARVVALDANAESLDILQKRKTYYESIIQRPLDIEVVCDYAHEADLASRGPFDSVLSIFAFNMMQPSGPVLDKIAEQLRPGGRLAILDGNSVSWLPRVAPSRRRSVWSPEQFETELQERGFAVFEHRGGIALPPLVWFLAPRAAALLDPVFHHNWFFPVSHLILAERSRST